MNEADTAQPPCRRIRVAIESGGVAPLVQRKVLLGGRGWIMATTKTRESERKALFTVILLPGHIRHGNNDMSAVFVRFYSQETKAGYLQLVVCVDRVKPRSVRTANLTRQRQLSTKDMVTFAPVRYCTE